MTEAADEAGDEVVAEESAAGGEVPPEEERWPIGFILTIVLTGVYLAYRLWQGLVLLWHWAFR